MFLGIVCVRLGDLNLSLANTMKLWIHRTFVVSAIVSPPKTRASCRLDRDRGPLSSSSCKLRPAKPCKMETWWRLWRKMKCMKLAAAKSCFPNKTSPTYVVISRAFQHTRKISLFHLVKILRKNSFEVWSTNSHLMSSYTNMKHDSYQADLSWRIVRRVMSKWQRMLESESSKTIWNYTKLLYPLHPSASLCCQLSPGHILVLGEFVASANQLLKFMGVLHLIPMVVASVCYISRWRPKEQLQIANDFNLKQTLVLEVPWHAMTLETHWMYVEHCRATK